MPLITGNQEAALFGKGEKIFSRRGDYLLGLTGRSSYASET